MKYTAAVLMLLAANSAQNAPGTNKGRHLDISAVSREANGSVVSIIMYKDGHQILQGSGFLISKDGDVVTNYHVIRNGSKGVIKLPDHTYYDIDGVLASDKDRDVAIVRAHGSDFRALVLGDSHRLQIGEEVVAIGSPLSLESTVSNGIISGIRAADEKGNDLLQITAPISPGSSGGPLFNMAGEVVGITTSHIEGGQNLNFAIPINDVKRMLGTTSARIGALPDEPETETVTAERTSGPSLRETLQWMVDSSAHGVESHAASDATSFDNSFYIFTKDFSCQDLAMVLTSVYRKGPTRDTTRYTYVFNLGDVDPDSVQDIPGRIAFRATDDRKKITVGREKAVDLDHIKSGQLISKDVLLNGEGSFFVSDDSYRGRLTKAFKHAVILCGGKQSKF